MPQSPATWFTRIGDDELKVIFNFPTYLYGGKLKFGRMTHRCISSQLWLKIKSEGTAHGGSEGGFYPLIGHLSLGNHASKFVPLSFPSGYFCQGTQTRTRLGLTPTPQISGNNHIAQPSPNCHPLGPNSVVSLRSSLFPRSSLVNRCSLCWRCRCRFCAPGTRKLR